MEKTIGIDRKIQSVAQECVEQIMCEFDLELGELSQEEKDAKAEELGWVLAEEIQGWFTFSSEPDLECDQEEQTLEFDQVEAETMRQLSMFLSRPIL